MFNIRLILLITFIINLYRTNGEISDKRLCGDENCEDVLSKAKTLLRYSSPGPGILSFHPNEEVKIYSKEAGSNTDLWGAEINGKRGYIPKAYVREYKVFKKPTKLVDTELQVPSDKEKVVKPDNIKEPYEVIDGTTIATDTINPTSTENPVLQTVSSTKEESKSTPEGGVVNSVLSSITEWITEENGDDEEEINIDEEKQDFSNTEGDKKSSQEDVYAKEDSNNKSETEEKKDAGTGTEVDSGRTINDPEKKTTETAEDSSHNATAQTIQPVDEEKFVTVSTQIKEVPPLNEESVTTNPSEKSQNITESNHVSAKGNQDQTVQGTEKAQSDTESKEQLSTASPLGGLFNSFRTSEEVTEKVKAVQVDNEVRTDTKKENLNSKEIVIEEANKGTVVDEANKGSVVESDKVADKTVSEENEADNTQGNVIATGQKEISEASDGVMKKESSNVQEVHSKDNKNEVPAPQGLNSNNILGFGNITVTDSLQPGEKVLDNKVNDQKETSETSEAVSKEESSHVQEVHSKDNKNEVPVPQGLNNNNISGFGNITVTDSLQPGEVVDNKVNDEKETSEVSDAVSKEESSNVQDVHSEDSKNEVPASQGLNSNNILGFKSPDNTNNENEAFNSHNIDKNINSPSTFESEEIIEESNDLNSNNDSLEPVEVLEDLSLPHQMKVMDIQKMDDDRIQNELEMLQDGNTQESRSADEPSVEPSDGFFSSLHSWFGKEGNGIESETEPQTLPQISAEEILVDNTWNNPSLPQCHAKPESYFNTNTFMYLITSAISCIIFLFVYMLIDRNRKEAPLIAKINQLEKQLFVALKENEMQLDKDNIPEVPEEMLEEFKHQLSEVQAARDTMQLQLIDLQTQLKKKDGQIENLEKELETSTEVGMELNRIISEMLDPTKGDDRLKENFDQLQRQLLEQKDTISSIGQALAVKETENAQLQVELESAKKSSGDLQLQVNKLLDRVLLLEKEKEQVCTSLQSEVAVCQKKIDEGVARQEILNKEIEVLRIQLSESQRQVELKTKEYTLLKTNINGVKALKNEKDLHKFIDSSSAKAQLEQLKSENEQYSVQLQQEQAVKTDLEQKWKTAIQDIDRLQQQYEAADKEKIEINMKLEVLNTYFKKRETELQEEVIKYKSIFDAKEGEATSTTERIKLMQEELENYKSQNEMLKQEILSQEIDLKSQISLLEKKAHENWLMARQTERKLEETRQEAAQLRNRLTLREMVINEERIQNRLQSPPMLDPHHHQNGDMTSGGGASGASSPVVMAPPPPFLPPPPFGAIPPPPHHLSFMPPPPPPPHLASHPPPPPPPGDHRPPPLGRMSSPPPSRYSPDTSAFSPYDRYSPSPPLGYDSEYGASPPPMRAYSPPYSPRDGKSSQGSSRGWRSSKRNAKGAGTSSGSEHSNESIEKIKRNQKMV